LGLGRRELELLFLPLASVLMSGGDKCLLDFCSGCMVDLGRESTESLRKVENFEIPGEDLAEDVCEDADRGRRKGGA